MRQVIYILIVAAQPIFAACQKKEPLLPPIDNPEGLLLIQSCTGCHAISNETLPGISELSKADMLAALKNYRDDDAGNTVMHRLMRGYDDKSLERLSDTLGQDE